MAVAVVLMAGCKEKDKNVPAVEVTLNKKTLEVTVNSSQILVATIMPSNATIQTLEWSSDKPGIAYVTQTGEVVGKSAGTAIITVKTHNGKEANCTVTVKKPAIAVTGMSLNETAIRLLVEQTFELMATIIPANADNQNVGWSSENEKIATVNETGKVTAVSAGVTNIVAVTNDKGFTKKCRVVVKNPGDEEYDKYLVRENLTTQELIEEMGVGINLGNTMEACGDWINKSNIQNYETAWGSPVVTEPMIAGYAKAGYSSLRIPVAWSNMMLYGYVIHPTLLDRIETIVNWTIDNDMVALVNLHWDGGWWSEFPTKYDECMKKFVAIWTQVSERFKAYGDRLMLESMNEVGFDALWTPWSGTQASKAKAFGIVNDMNQAFVDVVRASGGNNATRHLLIEVYNTGGEYAYDPLFKMPNDPANRCAATVHYYTPACFAIADGPTSWCPNGQAIPTWGTAADLKELNDNMNLLKKNCVDKGLPIIVGEFAACGNNKTQEMKRLYAVSVAEAVYSRGMCPMLWDTPGGQYDRNTFKFTDPVFEEMFRAIPNKYPRK